MARQSDLLPIRPTFTLHLAAERWPIAGAFAISRGSKTEAVVIVATLAEQTDGPEICGRGECVPYARYGETVESVTAALEAMRAPLRQGLDRTGLQQAMPPGAARNALDCAFWDWEAKRSGRRAYAIAGQEEPRRLTTAFTISLGLASDMAKAAKKAAGRPLLKIKLGAQGDPERIAAVRTAAPLATLIVDANEGWTAANLDENLTACRKAGVVLVEQPLPENSDRLLASMAHPIPLCADESAHGLASLAGLTGKYEAVNIKLDKAGGLTEALAMAGEAKRLGLEVMAGCMVSTSLSMAPAMLLAQLARYTDLDGPLLLAKDRNDGLYYADSLVYPPAPALWG